MEWGCSPRRIVIALPIHDTVDITVAHKLEFLVFSSQSEDVQHISSKQDAAFVSNHGLFGYNLQ